MTSPEVANALGRGRDRVVVPFGAVEQHGSHLPLETDALLGDHLGALLAERIDALCAPTVPIGCSEHHMAGAGTLSLQPATLRLIVRDVVVSLARHGFRTIVLLPTHAGNAAPIARAARVLEPPSGVRVMAVADMRALAAALSAASTRSGAALADTVTHAGEIETCLLLALAPTAVRPATDQAVRGDNGMEGSMERPHPGLSPSRVAAGTRTAMAAAGRAYVTAFLAECLRQLEAQGIQPCASA